MSSSPLATHLPAELFLVIFHFLPWTALKNCSLTCRSWSHMASFRLFHCTSISSAELASADPTALLDNERLRHCIKDLRISSGRVTRSSLRRLLVSLVHLSALRLVHKTTWGDDPGPSHGGEWVRRDLDVLELDMRLQTRELYESLASVCHNIRELKITLPLCHTIATDKREVADSDLAVGVHSLVVKHRGNLVDWADAFATLRCVLQADRLLDLQEVSPAGVDQPHIDTLSPYANMRTLQLGVSNYIPKKYVNLSAHASLTSLHLSAVLVACEDALLFESDIVENNIAAMIRHSPAGLQELHVELRLLASANVGLRRCELFGLKDEFYPLLRTFGWDVIGTSINPHDRPLLRTVCIELALLEVVVVDEFENDVRPSVMSEALQEMIPAWITSDRSLQGRIQVVVVC